MNVFDMRNARTLTVRTLSRKILRCNVDHTEFLKGALERALLEVNSKLTENLTFQLIMLGKIGSLVTLRVEVYEPRNQGPAGDAGILRTNQFLLCPRIHDFSQFNFQITPSRWMRVLGRQRPVEMISSPEMVAIGERNDSQLVVRSTRCRVNHYGEVIVPDSRAPVAVFADKFGFAIAREVTETDEG